MRCPFRMKAFDQPDTCDPDCAWLVKVCEATDKPMLVCAMTLAGSPSECPRRPLNVMERSKEGK